MTSTEAGEGVRGAQHLEQPFCQLQQDGVTYVVAE